MPAFKDKVFGVIQSSLSQLALRTVTYHKCPLTHDDVKALFIRPADLDHIERTSKIAKPDALGGTFDWSIPLPQHENACFTLTVSVLKSPKHPGFVVPSYAGEVLYSGKESEAFARLHRWVEVASRNIHEWALALHVLKWLQRNCTSPRQVRNAWPAIVPLLEFDDTTAPRADQIRAFKATQDMPFLPLGIREACRQTAGTVAKAMLLPNPAKKPPIENTQVALAVKAMTLTGSDLGTMERVV